MKLTAALLMSVPLASVFLGSGLSVEPTDDADQLARTLAPGADWVTGGELVAAPPEGVTTALVSGDIAGHTNGDRRAVLISTGDPASLTAPNDDGATGTSFNGPNARGDTDFDVTVLRIDLDVPDGVNCLTGIDFTFLSEEYPEYLNSAYNDGFIVELGTSTWTTKDSVIIAPDNIAFDPAGNIISVNATGPATMRERLSESTTFDAATPVLRAATPISPGRQSLFLSLFDQSDWAWDSAVIVSNLTLGTVDDLTQDCAEGVELALPEPEDGDRIEEVTIPPQPDEPGGTDWVAPVLATAVVVMIGAGTYRVLRRPRPTPPDASANAPTALRPPVSGRLAPGTTQTRLPDLGPVVWHTYLDHGRARIHLTEEHP
ncbi:MAG: choice-of-anchor L domain-containing protein [Actinomycetota bacterium]